MFRFDNKVVVITGGSKGIGFSAAEKFIEAGAYVFITGTNEAEGKKAADQLGEQAQFLKADVTKPEEVESFAAYVKESAGPADVLVNNAGIYAKDDFLTLSEESWRKILDVNLNGVFTVTKQFTAHMVEKGSGVIVNIASEAGLTAISNQVAYNVSKAALIMFTKSLAVDLAKHGIRVNAVCPGTTLTPLVEHALAAADDPEGMKKEMESFRPLDRLGKPEEIAMAVLSMAADEIGFANGSICTVDGGSTV